MFEVSLIPQKFVQSDKSKSSNSPQGAKCKILGCCLIWGWFEVFFPWFFLWEGGRQSFTKAFLISPIVPSFLQDVNRAEKSTHHPSGCRHWFQRPRANPGPTHAALRIGQAEPRAPEQERGPRSPRRGCRSRPARRPRPERGTESGQPQPRPNSPTREGHPSGPGFPGMVSRKEMQSQCLPRWNVIWKFFKGVKKWATNVCVGDWRKGPGRGEGKWGGRGNTGGRTALRALVWGFDITFWAVGQ